VNIKPFEDQCRVLAGNRGLHFGEMQSRISKRLPEWVQHLLIAATLELTLELSEPQAYELMAAADVGTMEQLEVHTQLSENQRRAVARVVLKSRIHLGYLLSRAEPRLRSAIREQHCIEQVEAEYLVELYRYARLSLVVPHRKPLPPPPPRPACEEYESLEPQGERNGSAGAAGSAGVMGGR